MSSQLLKQSASGGASDVLVPNDLVVAGNELLNGVLTAKKGLVAPNLSADGGVFVIPTSANSAPNGVFLTRVYEAGTYLLTMYSATGALNSEAYQSSYFIPVVITPGNGLLFGFQTGTGIVAANGLQYVVQNTGAGSAGAGGGPSVGIYVWVTTPSQPVTIQWSLTNLNRPFPNPAPLG
jgi:hypothetical protein